MYHKGWPILSRKHPPVSLANVRLLAGDNEIWALGTKLADYRIPFLESSENGG